MKNIIFHLIFCLLCITSYAQLKIGVKGGANYTNVIGKDGNGDKAAGHKFIPGFHAGLLFEYGLSQDISLQTEGVYSTKGFRLKNTSTSSPSPSTTIDQKFDVQYNLAYIDVPFLLNIYFGEMASYIGIGPQLSFLASSKWDGTATTTSTTTNPPNPPATSTFDYTVAGNDKKGYALVDFSAVIGTGSKWESGIEYCLRAGYGFTNVNDPSTSGSNDVLHNLVFTVSLGYGFDLGGGGGKKRSYKRR